MTVMFINWTFLYTTNINSLYLHSEKQEKYNSFCLNYDIKIS